MKASPWWRTLPYDPAEGGRLCTRSFLFLALADLAYFTGGGI